MTNIFFHPPEGYFLTRTNYVSQSVPRIGEFVYLKVIGKGNPVCFQVGEIHWIELEKTYEDGFRAEIFLELTR